MNQTQGSTPDPQPNTSASTELVGYEVLVCVCGGIAAYKTATLVSRLVQRGAGVTVAMTAAAQHFVGATTFRALSGRHVYTGLWDASPQIDHLKLTERADLLVVSPATANILGKLANGVVDDFVSTLLLGADCPILMAPAMNERMWRHPATRRNVAFLRDEVGVAFVGPDEGWQACRAVGPGRMSEPETILDDVMKQLKSKSPRTAG